ncbi:hypothetical protein ACE6H2_015780 [Prunus campanulata]
MGFKYLDDMAHKRRLKLRFRLCADIPNNGCSPKRRGARGIEIRSGGGSSSGLPNSLPSRECKSRTRLRSDNICGFHSGSPSIHCGHSPNCVRREREGPKPSRLNRGDAGPSYSMRDDPRPSHFGHRHLHSDRDREASLWTSVAIGMDPIDCPQRIGNLWVMLRSAWIQLTTPRELVTLG